MEFSKHTLKKEIRARLAKNTEEELHAFEKLSVSEDESEWEIGLGKAKESNKINSKAFVIKIYSLEERDI